jgi:hypothetical protein
MNKAKAMKMAEENTMTIRELRDLIAAARGKGGQSRVKPQLAKEDALDIFEWAIADRLDDEIPAGTRDDTRDQLMIANILRECA